jgi:tetraacyldisaccharide 4'-kinase
MGSWVNNFLFDHRLRKVGQAPLPVVSVGNLAFGGSGKTPLVMHLLDACLEEGVKPALITRGYKGKWEKTGGILSDGKKIYGTWLESGDEPYMVWRNFPRIGIFVGKNRWVSCERAKQAGFSIAILDDGFQHRKLHRDMDIVLFDPGEKMALREFVSALRRAGTILVSDHVRVQDRIRMMKKFPGAKVFSYSIANKGFFAYPEGRSVSPDHLREKTLVAVCGIARPQRFFSLLEKEGIKPAFSLAFPDHHAYPDSTNKKITAVINQVDADAVITTEKDVFKLDAVNKTGRIPVYFNKIDIRVEEPFTKEFLSHAKEDG